MAARTTPAMHLDQESCRRAVTSRDRRFDGVFVTAVHSTGIYCRPSCPARTPAMGNVTFHPTAAAAQEAGFRACRRCAPDASPGSPEWDVAGDVAGRAMRLIADGFVDREGVAGLAGRLGFSPRHLSRLLVTELGAGPLALARARRAQNARTLLEATDLSVADVAFAAGFGSVRQFNDTVRSVYAATPTQLRGRRGRSGGAADGGRVAVRLPVRTPYAGGPLMDFLAVRAVPRVEVVRDGVFAGTMRLPHGSGVVELTLPSVCEPGHRAYATATFTLTDLRDLGAATERVRRLVDADCDPVAVDALLEQDPLLGPSVRRMPGVRVPGHVDGFEVAVRAVLGQQVTVAAARTLAARLVETYGDPVSTTVDGLDRLFPTPARLAEVDGTGPGMPRARLGALRALAVLVAGGELRLDRGDERSEVRRRLLAVPGIGPWTADYVAMRALGDPDCFLPSDTGTRDALRRHSWDPARASEWAEAWRPWRSYAQMRLWQSYEEEQQ